MRTRKKRRRKRDEVTWRSPPWSARSLLPPRGTHHGQFRDWHARSRRGCYVSSMGSRPKLPRREAPEARLTPFRVETEDLIVVSFPLDAQTGDVALTRTESE